MLAFKHLFFLAVALAIFCSVSAFSIDSPSKVDVFGDKNIFFVSVTNNTNSVQPIIVNFYSTAKAEISHPKSLAPNTSGKIKITVYRDSTQKYHEVDSKLEVYLGKDLEEKNITLRFFEENNSSAFSAFFSLITFSEETSRFASFEWILFWILVIVAAVLLVSFVSKIVRRA